MLVLLIEGIYEHVVDMALCGIIYIPSFMMISRGVQEISRVCSRNLKRCNIGIEIE
jgi:hypothetical protein